MMRAFLAYVLVLLQAAGGGSPEVAQEAYARKDWSAAVTEWQRLAEEQPLLAGDIRFNLGLVAYQKDSFSLAMQNWRTAVKFGQPEAASAAQNNMGCLLLERNPDKREDALGYFRQALLLNPANELARYNYELVLRQLNQQPPEPPVKTPPPPTAENPAPPPPTEQYGAVQEDTVTSLPLAEKRYRELVERQEQFLQQLRKHRKREKRFQDTPNW